MIKNRHDTIDRYLRLHVSILNYKAKGQEEHRQLLDACRRRDTAAAVALLEQHIQTVAVLLAAYLPQDQGSPPRTHSSEQEGHA